MNKAIIKHLIKKDNDIVIIEIGAANGSDTAEFLSTFESVNKFKIYAIEPHPRNFNIINEHFCNNNRVHLSNAAISDKSGETDFYISVTDRNSDLLALSSSIVKPKEHLAKWPMITFDEKIKINSFSLDDFVENQQIDVVDFIWADVQGAERHMIQGGIKTLTEKTRFLYTEYSNIELYENQPNLRELQELLPDFYVVHDFVHDFSGDVLFANRRFE